MTKRAILHPTIRNAIDWQEMRDPVVGKLPEGRIAVVVNGERMAHVSHKAGPSVAQRLINRPVSLGTHEGKPAWIARPPRGVPARRGNVSAVDQLTALKAAKGSVSEQHDKPETHARPRRGS